MTTLTNFAALLSLGGGGGGGGDLATVLGSGNTTGGSDIEFSSGDGIVTTANGAGAGFDLVMSAGDAGGVLSDGGDFNIFPGSGFGGGVDGVINLNGDVVVSGTLTLSNLLSGTGTPEGVEAAPPSTLFQRTDGDISTNANLYVKVSGVGMVGWVPLVPPVFETFVAVGVAVFTTSRSVFDDPTSLGVENIAVYWNGVLQREGGPDDYTVAFESPGAGTAEITFTSIPPPGDFITIRYLPA